MTSNHGTYIETYTVLQFIRLPYFESIKFIKRITRNKIRYIVDNDEVLENIYKTYIQTRPLYLVKLFGKQSNNYALLMLPVRSPHKLKIKDFHYHIGMVFLSPSTIKNLIDTLNLDES